MNKDLGKYLKECRGLVSMSLRDVEIAINISNAYLSQLENNKIKKPSANVLYKLATLYGVSIESMLFHSGLIDEKPKDKRLVMIETSGVLTSDEEFALLEYLKYIRFKDRNNGSSS